MTVSAIFKVAASAVFVLTPAAMAQEIQIAQIQKEAAEFNGRQFVFRTFSDSYPSKVVTDAPYSAEEKSITTQALADGNRIVTSVSTRLYRDRQGRTRSEQIVGGSPLVTITDPVANTRYILGEKNRSATKLALAKPSTEKLAVELAIKKADEAKARAGNGPTLLNGQPVDMKNEDLGTQLMEGVSVQGTRTVLTIPQGQIGNDRPIVVITERWFSPELQMVIMSKRSDPRLGETLYSITNISRANPDLSLFQVPAGYSESERRQ